MTLILTSKPLSNSTALYLLFLATGFCHPALSELVWRKRFCTLDLCHKTFRFCFQTRIFLDPGNCDKVLTRAGEGREEVELYPGVLGR